MNARLWIESSLDMWQERECATGPGLSHGEWRRTGKHTWSCWHVLGRIVICQVHKVLKTKSYPSFTCFKHFFNVIFQLQLTFNTIFFYFRCVAQWLNNYIIYKVVISILRNIKMITSIFYIYAFIQSTFQSYGYSKKLDMHPLLGRIKNGQKLLGSYFI